MSFDLEPSDDDREGSDSRSVDLAALDDGERALLLDQWGTKGAATVLPASTNGSRPARSEPLADERTWLTLGEIMDRSREPLTFLPFLGRDGFMVEGWTHVLASAPRCGKTELMAHALVPWLREGKRVLVLSEEPLQVWQDRGSDLVALYGAEHLRPAVLVVSTMGREPGDLLAIAKDAPAEIVIADTLRHVAGMKDENDAAEVRRCVAPWIDGMRVAGKTFIAQAHDRKGATGKGGESVAGSHALVALFDVILRLQDDPANDRRRILSGTGRRIEVPKVTTEWPEGERMVILGDTRSVGRIERERACLAAVQAADEPLTTRDVRVALGSGAPSVVTVLHDLTSLAAKKVIRRNPELGEPAERVTVRWAAVDLFTGAPK